MGGREHRTGWHPTDFEQPPPSLSIRSLRRDVPPGPAFRGTGTSPSATALPAGLAATTLVRQQASTGFIDCKRLSGRRTRSPFTSRSTDPPALSSTVPQA